MRLLAVVLGFAAVLMGADKPPVPRETMKNVELNFGSRLVKLGKDGALDLVGEPRGLYLPGYGVVISADVNLVALPPFPPRASLEPAEVAELRNRKIARLPGLRTAMRQAMVDAATVLNAVPEGERIVVVVSLYNFKYENVDGIPGQILMEATRKDLRAFGPKTADETVAAKLKMHEFTNAPR